MKNLSWRTERLRSIFLPLMALLALPLAAGAEVIVVTPIPDIPGRVRAETYFLERQGNKYTLRPFSDGRPNVIPIKFPDDLSGGPGGEEPPQSE